MKKRIAAVLTAVLALVLGFAILTACGGETTQGGGSGELKLTETEIVLGVGDAHNLSASMSGAASISWTTSDETVVKITNQTKRGACYISALKAGSAVLTATESASGKTATCSVTVTDFTVVIDGEASFELERFATKKLTASVLQDGKATNESVLWSSSAPDVVSVAADGTVRGESVGDAVITAKRTSGSASASVNVTVVWSEMPEGYYTVEEKGSMGALENLNKWSWSGFQGSDDLHPDVTGEGWGDKGEARFVVSGNTGWRWYGAQLFYRNDTLTAGDTYTVTIKLTSTAAGGITVNNRAFELTAGENTITFVHKELGNEEMSLSVALSTHDIIRNGLDPLVQYKAGTIDITEITWTPYTPEKLSAPTAISIGADGELTITDSNDDSAREGYVIGFFKNADDAEPAFTQSYMKPVGDYLGAQDKDLRSAWTHGGKMYVDASFVEAGTYTVKAYAYSGDASHLDSDWGTATASYTKSGAVSYPVVNTYRDVDRGIGRFYVWSEWNQFELANCKYENDALTLQVTGQGSWYSNQVFYHASGLEAGKTYVLKFTFAGKTVDGGSLDLTGKQIVVNGQRVNPENDKAYELKFQYDGGAAITMLLGQPNEDWSGDVPNGGLDAGVYTFKNISITAYTPAAAEDVDSFLEEDSNHAVNNPGHWYHWIDQGWEGGTVTITKSVIDEAAKTFTFGYTTAGWSNLGFSVQLYYENPGNTNGKAYRLTAKLKLDVGGTITVNGTQVVLAPNEEKAIDIVYGETGDPSFSIQMGVYHVAAILDGEITISDWKWEEVTVDPDAETYDLLGVANDFGKVPADSVFYFYAEYPNDGLHNAKYDHGKVTFDIAGSGNWYSNAIFFKSSVIPDGEYTFKMKINSTVAGTIRINNVPYELKVGDNDIEIQKSAGTLEIRMGEAPKGADGNYDWDHGGNASPTIAGGSFTFSDFSWTSADGTVYDLSGKVSA